MLGRWAVLLALSVTSFAAPVLSQGGVTFRSGLAISDIRQLDKTGTKHFYFVDAQAGAQLRSVKQDNIRADESKAVGTPFQFIPTTSAFMKTDENTSTKFVHGHIALASNPKLHLTVNAAALKGEYLVIPSLESARSADDETQADQFWSLDRSTGALTFMAEPFTKVDPFILTGFGPFEQNKPEVKVRLIGMEKTTSRFAMPITN